MVWSYNSKKPKTSKGGVVKILQSGMDKKKKDHLLPKIKLQANYIARNRWTNTVNTTAKDKDGSVRINRKT